MELAMRIVLAATGLLLAASPLLAQTPAVPKRGATIRDVNSTRVGVVDRVNADGSVQIIFASKFVTIPADKLTVTNNAVATSLTKAEVAKMR